MSAQDILAKAAATIELAPAKFSTGSRGYRGQGKVMQDGKKYQVSIMAVEVGSKPKEE